MSIRSVPAVAATVLVIGAVPAAATAVNSNPAALGTSLRAELGRYLSARRTAEHISAVSLAVTFPARRPGINVAVGSTRYGVGRRISPYALWQIGSNTKAFTAVVLLQLEAEHRLSINDRIGKWLPQYRAWRNVPIKRLLNMTSGIQGYTEQLAFLRAYVAKPSRVFSASHLVAYAAGLPRLKGYHYSNTNYIVAQMIIEHVTHDNFADQLRRRILVPLALHNTFYSVKGYPQAVTARLPAGYFFFKSVVPMASLLGKDQRRRNLSWAQGAGAIVSSLQDMAKWDRALYTGRELPHKQQRELQSLVSLQTGKPIRRTTLTDPAGFGLGVIQTTTPTKGTVWTYTGETWGYRVLHIYLPRSRSVIAIGVNSATEDSALSALGTSVYQILHRAGLS